MDPLSVVASLASVVSLAIQVLSLVKSYEKLAISRTYGRPLGWVIVTFFGNTATEYERIERIVLRGSDDEALRFRDSVITECNMTAVAVSRSLRVIDLVIDLCTGRHYRPGGAHSALPAKS